MSQLYGETGEGQCATAIARVEARQGDRIPRHVDMVEENVVREDPTFAEMAQVAVTEAQDEGVDAGNPSELVNRLYGAVDKTKRSPMRSFVFLLSVLEDSLKWPKEASRNLGVEVSCAIKGADQTYALKSWFADGHSAAAQTKLLESFLETVRRQSPWKNADASPKQKFEFHVGKTKVTLRSGECRSVSDRDFAAVPKDLPDEAVEAFEAALAGGPRVR